jgi:hypothetical protein
VRGVLLNPKTGAAEGTSHVPASDEVAEWTRRLDRSLALDRNRQLLEAAVEFPHLRATSTTMRYLCHPAAANGISRASSGAAWGTGSAYTEIVAANAIAATFYVAGVTWSWWTPIVAADTTYEIEVVIASGAASAEVEQIVIPASVRVDTAVGPVPSQLVTLPEPREFAANTRLSVKLRYGTAAAVTLTGIKLLYQRV